MFFHTMVHKLTLILFFAGCVLLTRAQQNIKDFTLQHIHTVQTIDPSANSDTDLADIGKAIGNARIVMLGEQDHGVCYVKDMYPCDRVE